MKTKKHFKSVLSVLLAVVMICSVMAPMTAMAKITVDSTKLGDDMYLTSKTDYTVAPGITESHITTNNSAGNNQIASYVLEVDLNNSATSIIASYKDYDGSSWGFQKVRDQAYAAEAKRGVNVVAGINADFFNMQTGEPQGALVMNGTTYKAASGRPYFGITASGKAVISTGKLTDDIVEAVGGLCLLVDNGELTSEVYNNGYGDYTAPRTAVGIKADGSVLLYVADGRQAPYSVGQYFIELASTLRALGCVQALCLDGGGSSTYISQHEGSDELVCRNSPSDGSERTVTSSLLVCSSAKPSGEFHHASLAPNNQAYTPNSTVAFTATGVDSSGYAAELPADGTFALADESYGTIDAQTGVFTSTGKTGTVTVNYMSDGEVCGNVSIDIVIPDELYVSSTEQAVGPGVTTDFGIVAKYKDRDVNLNDNDIEWSIVDQTNDRSFYIYFNKDQFKDSYLTASTYGTYVDVNDNNRVKNNVSLSKLDWDCGYTVLKLFVNDATQVNVDDVIAIAGTLEGVHEITKVADINGIAGTFSGITFTGAEDNAYNAVITADLKCNEELSLELTVFIGSKQVMLYDFEYTTDAEEAESSDTLKYIPSYTLPTYGSSWQTANGYTNATISEKLREEGYPLYMWPNGAIKNDTVTADIVTAAEGEPVRFGEKSLRISFDFSSYNQSSNGNFYLRATDALYAFEGSPTAIGVWVYAPEGTTGYALYLNCATNVDAEGNAYGTSAYTTGDKINWVGWKYLELDLTGNVKANNTGGAYTPYGEGKGCGVFWISYQPANMGNPSADTIYIDNMTLIYGANTDDTINPVVNYLGDLTDSIVDGETVYNTNTVSFKASYADVEDKYMTGIDDAATKLYLDGVDVTDKCYINEGDDEIYFYDAVLSDGVHNIEVEVCDVFGNKTTEMRYFTIDSNSDDIEVAFTAVDESPVLGKDYTLAITTNDAENVTSADIKVKVLSDYTSYWRDVNVVPSENYELEGEAVYNSINDTLTFKVVRKADASAENDDGTLAKIVTAVPTNVPEGLEVTHRVAKGALTLATETEDKYTACFSGKITAATIAPYVISTDVMIVGAEGGYIYVTDNEGKVAEGVNVYTTDNTLIGTTDEDGKVYTSDYVSAVCEFSIYAEKDGLLSFVYTSQSYNAGGDETGAPTNVILNATENATTSQSIAWMASPLTSGDDVIVKYATKADYEANGEDAFVTFNAESYIAEVNASGDVLTNYAVRFNSAVITGLEANTEYVYIVGDGVNMSAVKTFKTAKGNTDTNFFVMGDTQSADTSNVEAIFTQLAASGTEFDFGMQTGDAVDNAGKYSYWDGIGSVFSGEFIGETSVVHVLGNHEYTGDSAGISAAKYFTLPGTTDEAPLAYSFEYGNVYVAVFSYLLSADAQAAADWLVEDAAASTATWKILTMHQPPYFTNMGGGTTREMMDKITAAVDEADIDFVFSGHDHSYARTYPITAGVQDEDGAVYYICAATSAEKGYQITTDESIHAMATDEYNAIYLTVKTTDTTFEVTTWNYDGENHNVFDTYTATKAVTCTEEGLHDYAHADGVLTCNVCGYTTTSDGYTGWVSDAETGKLMYLIGGNIQTGWFSMGTDHYCFDENGLAQTGEVTFEGHTYLFGDDGKMLRGALEKNSDGTYSYYINGAKQRGWFEIDGYWYYFSRTNSYKTLKGTKSVNGMYYTFSNSGKLIKGAWNTTEQGKCYYWGPYPVTGLQEIDGTLYYFSPADTYMIVNDSAEVDGIVYAFGSDGKFIHYDAHADEDGDGVCDTCASRSNFMSFIDRLLAFFTKIKTFFSKLFV